jgi:hypothetical protein
VFAVEEGTKRLRADISRERKWRGPVVAQDKGTHIHINCGFGRPKTKAVPSFAMTRFRYDRNDDGTRFVNVPLPIIDSPLSINLPVPRINRGSIKVENLV